MYRSGAWTVCSNKKVAAERRLRAGEKKTTVLPSRILQRGRRHLRLVLAPATEGAHGFDGLLNECMKGMMR